MLKWATFRYNEVKRGQTRSGNVGRGPDICITNFLRTYSTGGDEIKSAWRNKSILMVTNKRERDGTFPGNSLGDICRERKLEVYSL